MMNFVLCDGEAHFHLDETIECFFFILERYTINCRIGRQFVGFFHYILSIYSYVMFNKNCRGLIYIGCSYSFFHICQYCTNILYMIHNVKRMYIKKRIKFYSLLLYLSINYYNIVFLIVLYIFGAEVRISRQVGGATLSFA